MKSCAKVLLATVAILGFVGVAEAAQYSEAVQKYCRNDYRKFCGDYGLDSPALRSCMDRNGKSLSKSCVNALVKSGQVSRAEVERRKKKH
jgi:hypothetical protein